MFVMPIFEMRHANPTPPVNHFRVAPGVFSQVWGVASTTLPTSLAPPLPDILDGPSSSIDCHFQEPEYATYSPQTAVIKDIQFFFIWLCVTLQHSEPHTTNLTLLLWSFSLVLLWLQDRPKSGKSYKSFFHAACWSLSIDDSFLGRGKQDFQQNQDL